MSLLTFLKKKEWYKLDRNQKYVANILILGKKSKNQVNVRFINYECINFEISLISMEIKRYKMND